MCDRVYVPSLADREMVIPRIFHWVWLGDRPLPEQYRGWIDHWLGLHPGWRALLWTDSNRPRLRNEAQFVQATKNAQRASILRYEVVLKHGGVYLDCDIQCCRNVEPLLRGLSAFTVEDPDGGSVNNAAFGATPSHPWMADLVRDLPDAFRAHTTIGRQAGPQFMDSVTTGRSDVRILPSQTFYPITWRDKSEDPGPCEAYPEAYAIHHWHASWVQDELNQLDHAIAQVVPVGATVFLILSGLFTEALPNYERLFRFSRAAFPPKDSAAAIREFDRRRPPGLEWVVIHWWAFWWFEEYPAFIEHLESMSRNVLRTSEVAAFELDLDEPSS